MLLALVADSKLPPQTFVVTFDDGYANVYHYAWPILRELQIPATIFLPTGFIDGTAPFPFDDWVDKASPGVHEDRWRPLSRAQIREMLQDPLITFGSHTHSHMDFRGAPDLFASDLAKSQDILRNEFAVNTPAFAFPGGVYDQALMQIVRCSGVSCALTVEPELIGRSGDCFRLGRFNVDEFDTPETLRFKLNGWYSQLKHWCSPRKSVLGRVPDEKRLGV